MKKLIVTEKRDATCYIYIKKVNKKWIAAQAKAHKMKQSPLMDMYIDNLRAQFPLPVKTKAEAPATE